MTTTIFGGLEFSAAENEYDFSNLKVESVSKDEIDNLSKVIEIHENKNSETLNIIGESEDTSFELNYDIENNEEFIYSAKEFKASNPAIIFYIIRYGVQQAIKKYGKNAVRLSRNAVTKSDSPV
ncbi:hypothetical protein [Macrococcoides caseolyticum]|uniref:hypothetical protein n=1 Tax=Macrococcoides caseolyticum TaxID=69966 RepID=UPI001F428D6E|nr:hypothetical protein [Macrococcus caseolyticus]MCE4956646.1 hypothetical protein [Macrococcus caseolyticus]